MHTCVCVCVCVCARARARAYIHIHHIHISYMYRRSRSQTGAQCMRAQSTTLASFGADAGNIHRPSALDSTSAESAHAPVHKRRRAAHTSPIFRFRTNSRTNARLPHPPERCSGERPWPGGDCPPARLIPPHSWAAARLSPKCAGRNGAGSHTAQRTQA